MNAIDLLEQQHEETLQMLEELEESDPGAERKETFKKLQSSLLAHMVIEEELFYPAVAETDDGGEPVAEGYEEHAGARVELERCARAVAEEDLFGIRICVLKEMVKHHIQEERTEILPRARKEKEADELEELGAEMEERFEAAKKAASPAARLDKMTTSRELDALSA
jgi:hypothetical protein